MVVRGYNGSMSDRSDIKLRLDDWLPCIAGMLVLVLVVAWQ
jgi:hypothetical protein